MRLRYQLETPLNVRASQTLRTVWLAFTVLAVSLAILGIPRYFSLLQTPCRATPCVGRQLTVDAAHAWVAGGDNLLLYAVLQVLVALMLNGLLLSTAAFLMWRQSANRAATLAAFVGTALATSTLSQALAATDPRFLVPIQGILFVQLAGLLPLVCLFPDGQFQPRGMRWVAIVYVCISAVSLTPHAAAWVAPGTIGHALWLGFAVMAGLIVAATLWYRFRYVATSAQQEQMRWVMAGLGLAAPVALEDAHLSLINGALRLLRVVPDSMLFSTSLIMLFLAVGSATCMLVALVQYEPLNAEVIINRALVYAALTAFVIGTYVVIVGYLSSISRSDNVLFSLIATGLVAVLFQPLRDLLQRTVNHMMYGERDEPYAVISHLGERLQTTLAPDAVLPMIVETVAEALKLPYVAIVFATEATAAEAVAAAGTPGADIQRLPLVYGGETVGYLLMSPRSGEATLAHTDQRLLADLAKQAGPVVHGVRLMSDLHHMTVALQRSREGLVLAREDDRRRLRRDLHDELAPSLAGLSLAAGTIKSVARSDPATVEALATELHTALRRAVGDIRRLVYDLRPPALDDLGLVAAIQERAAQFSSPPGAAPASETLRVAVDLPAPLPPLSAAVEVAAYRIVQEAMMNVVRHAHASQCRIRMVVDRGTSDAHRLELAIVDDGIGIDAARRAGVGLRSMRERAEELGGTCDVGPLSSGGTRVFVQLPIGTEERHEHAAHPDR